MSSGQPEKPCDSAAAEASATSAPDCNVYVVEKIVGKRLKGGRLQYLVKWLGFSDEENTWEPLEGVIHCCDLLADFEAELLRRSQGQNAGGDQEQKQPQGATKKTRKSTKKPKRRHSSSVSREMEQPEAEVQAVINPPVKGKGKGNPKAPIPRRHSCSHLESNADPVDLEMQRIHSSPVDMMPPQVGGHEDTPSKDDLPSSGEESIASEDGPDSWKMPERTKPFGLERGLELEKVHHCFKVRDKTFLFVSWKGCDEVDAVRLEEIRQAYPIPIIKFFEGLKLSDH
ncbi:chromo domain-containing protein rhino-like [Drosophila takahashii]|uniref:chromo domain-containing protein rhino-like n=1 Tax=Drosophila takahashii TaxID=29030 RepID=UPI001CF845CF|nr:chromo domain-containing protein cec-1-like [Drosophila takahashii]